MQAALGMEIGDLREVADGDAALECDGAFIRRQKAGEQIEQGGFARAIWSYQADAVARFDAKGDAAEDQLGAIGFGERCSNEDGHGGFSVRYARQPRKRYATRGSVSPGGAIATEQVQGGEGLGRQNAYSSREPQGL